MNDPHLTYFEDYEFIRDDIQWLPMMPSDLVVRLDVLRHQWGRPISISGHPKALGRRLGDSGSYHNIEKHGMVMAADIQPDGVTSRTNAYSFYMAARDVGFTGIGFYPGWSPTPGFHVDVRRDRGPGNPATWGFVLRGNNLVQISLNDALSTMA